MSTQHTDRKTEVLAEPVTVLLCPQILHGLAWGCISASTIEPWHSSSPNEFHFVLASQ